MRLPARWLVRRHPRAFLCACVGCALTCLTCLALLLARRGSPPGVQLRTDAQLVLQHYDARQLLFRRRARRIVFLHIHKAAGSTVCQLAIDAGELVNRDNNCNLAGAAKRDLAAGTEAEQCSALRWVPGTGVRVLTAPLSHVSASFMHQGTRPTLSLLTSAACQTPPGGTERRCMSLC